MRDAGGITAGAALDRLHAAFPELPRRPLGFPLAAYLELHIEQGPVLEAEARVIGVVTGLQGKKTFAVAIAGAEGHVGTVPMAGRRDALATFAHIAAALHASVGALHPDIKFTIDSVGVAPNTPSVIPAAVRFTIDLRHPDNAVLGEAGARVVDLCRSLAAPCDVDVTPLVDAPSNPFDPGLRAAIARAAEREGLPAMPILSCAGHDARHLAPLCPSAMIFVPCRDSVSHVEHEWAEPAHVAAGTAVLGRVLDDLLAGRVDA